MPGEVLVRFKGDASLGERQASHAGVGAQSRRRLAAVRGLELVSLDGDMSVADAIARYEAMDEVAYAQPNYIKRAQAVPNDPLLTRLWGLDNAGQIVDGSAGVADADIDVPEAWDVSKGSKDVVVAVLDTGIDLTHPDLVANIWTNPGEIAGNRIDDDRNGYVDDVHGWDGVYKDGMPEDGEDHGTHVAGTIGAVGDNGVGVAGVNWNVTILPLRMLDEDGNGTTESELSCLNYLKQFPGRVKVVNASWGGTYPFDQAEYDALAGLDALVVAAAGNSNSSIEVPSGSTGRAFYPAAYDLPNLITVGATTNSDVRWKSSSTSGSNYGATAVDVFAPGRDIQSAVRGGGFDYMTGTSMAAPHVAGLAALILSKRDLSVSQLKQRIMQTVDVLPALSNLCVTGGRVNAYAALTADGGLAPDGVPDAFGALSGQPLVVSAPGVLANDTPGGGGDLRAEIASMPGNGTLSLSADGGFTYVPEVGFSGTDTFRYTVVEGTRQAGPVTVTISVSDGVLQASLQMGSSAVTIDYGATYTIRGVLTADTRALPGRPVVIWSNTPGQPPQPTGLAATSGDDGTFEVTVQPLSKTTYTAVLAASADVTAAQGTPVVVTPRVRLSAPSGSRIGARKYRVRGTLEPVHASGTKVRLYYQKSSGGKKHSLSVSTSARGADSAYSTKIKFPSSGKYRVWAHMAKDAGHAVTTGPARTVTVR